VARPIDFTENAPPDIDADNLNLVQDKLMQVASNVQTGSPYELVLADGGRAVDMNSASATVVVVPPNSTVEFPVGTVIEVGRLGTGTVTLFPGSGVQLRSRDALLGIANRYSTISLRKIAADEWLIVGDLV
jgi:hypothetical protein